MVKRAKPKEVAPVGVAQTISKGKYEKIPGTRVQMNKHGVMVRTVIEDGKEFDPSNARRARQHVLNLGKTAAEKADIARKIAGDDLIEEAIATFRGDAGPRPSKAEKEAATVVKKLGKTKGKGKAVQDDAARLERRRQSVEQHLAKAREEGREMVEPETWCEGQIVQRAGGLAWLSVREGDATRFPTVVVARLRAMQLELPAASAAAAAAAESNLLGPVLPVAFLDVAQDGLRLEPGVALRCRLYMDRRGVGGGEAVDVAAASAPAPADGGLASDALAADCSASDALPSESPEPIRDVVPTDSPMSVGSEAATLE